MTTQYALIFANGAANDGPLLQQTLQHTPNPLIIAADGGARLAQQFGFTPDIVVGDMDSLSADELQQLKAAGVRLEQYPQQKNETDLELALQWAANNNIEHIRIIGALGRRIDQTFGNVYLLALPALVNRDVRIVSGSQQLWLARPGEHIIDGSIDDTLSLLPLASEVINISTTNLFYPLNKDTLHFGPTRGMSNVLTTPRATVTFEQGVLLIVHTLGHAE